MRAKLRFKSFGERIEVDNILVFLHKFINLPAAGENFEFQLR